MDKALICGSFAFDNIMVFNDRFKNHILPDKVHILNVSFLVPQLRREFGGCAGNIAYNLKLLGGDPLPMGTVGTDFEHYAQWMDDHGISREYVTVLDDTFTAQAFITTDMDDNQITAFHPGSMDYSHYNSVLDVKDPAVGIVAPDGRDGMIQHASEFVHAGIPFIFDPGQGLPMFDGDELMNFIDQATWLTVNDYEWQLIQERTGKTQDEIAEYLDALIITKGPEGSLIYNNYEVIEVPAAKPSELKDPTGCGDAYRAGLLYGLTNNLNWEITGRIASLMGAIKIEHQGTQNHRFEIEDFKKRFEESFDMSF
ncbi:MAG: carbohydrate kinase family protein [Methanohalobium sp.]|uniref:carbohydrate kinase family protein n=1 Tax=Methanohalobium sp. TaxID=2837493 RepID=UPI00397B9D3B